MATVDYIYFTIFQLVIHHRTFVGALSGASFRWSLIGHSVLMCGSHTCARTIESILGLEGIQLSFIDI